jgi:hypothetical protein
MNGCAGLRDAAGGRHPNIEQDATKGKQIDEEVRALKAALSALDAAVERLREADQTVSGLLELTGEKAAMPNSRRAEQQMRMAINASVGARRSLQRRLELRRAVVAQGRGNAGDGE